MPDDAQPGEPRAHITLAQLLKFLQLVDSGGQAKHRVRAGGILVNGEEEVRPGRKLYPGDTVTVDGEDYEVDLAGEEGAEES